MVKEGTDFENGRDQFIELLLEDDGVINKDDNEKIKSDVAVSAKDDVVQKSGVVDGVKGNEDDGVINRDDIDKLKSDDVSVKASLVKKDDVMLKLRLNYGVFGGVKGNEDGKKKKEVVDLTDDDPVPQPKSATELDKWNPADFEYSLQNPLSIIDHNQLKELDPKSESALLVDFTQPTLQELATQLQIPGQEHGAQLQMHGEEDGALLAKKTLVDKEVTLGYFLVKAKYLENVKKLVKYEQKIVVCEKDDVDQQFTMQFFRYASSNCSYFKGDGLKSYYQKMGAQADDQVELEYDEGTFFIAFYSREIN